jgi:hypothetical protein
MTPRSVERARRREDSDIFSMNGTKYVNTENSPQKLIPITKGILKGGGSALAVREMVAKNQSTIALASKDI